LKYIQIFAELFARVAEAYEVLRQQDLRAIFDQFGEEGLKKGLPQVKLNEIYLKQVE